MLYWWAVRDEPEADLHDPHQHDGVFSAVACMEAAQRQWEAAHPGAGMDLHLIQLDGCIAEELPREREAEVRDAFAQWRGSA